MKLSEVMPYKGMELTKKKQVALMFDNIAPTYDRLNKILSLGIDRWWRRRALSYLQAVQPQTVLDMATGTADLAIAIAQQLKPSLVVGMDISENMLAVGKQKVEQAQLGRVINLKVGDAENLPFDNNTFDAVSVSFGVRNFENLERGLSEMQRVLRQGGRLVILEFSKPQAPVIKQVYQAYFTHVLPRIGRLISKDTTAYTYLPQSVAAFPEGEQLVQLLRKKGFKTAKCIPLTFGICSIYVTDK